MLRSVLQAPLAFRPADRRAGRPRPTPTAEQQCWVVSFPRRTTRSGERCYGAAPGAATAGADARSTERITVRKLSSRCGSPEHCYGSRGRP
jgi:hypothetical protein